MYLKKFAVAAAATMSLVAAPVMAQAPASKLSVAQSARAGAPAGSEQLAGGSLIIAVLAAAAVVAGIVIAADSDDSPNSP